MRLWKSLFKLGRVIGPRRANHLSCRTREPTGVTGHTRDPLQIAGWRWVQPQVGGEQVGLISHPPRVLRRSSISRNKARDHTYTHHPGVSCIEVNPLAWCNYSLQE